MHVPVQSAVLLSLLATGATASNPHHKRSPNAVRTVPFLASRGAKAPTQKQSAASASMLGCTTWSPAEQLLGGPPRGLQASLKHIEQDPKASVVNDEYMAKLLSEGLDMFRSVSNIVEDVESVLHLGLRADGADAANEPNDTKPAVVDDADTATPAVDTEKPAAAVPAAAPGSKQPAAAAAKEPVAATPAAASAGGKEAAPPSKGGFSPTTNSTVGVTDAQTNKAGLRDLAALVNPFIGTKANSNPGNVFPGASVPFGMMKIGIDVDVYAPAGYNDDPNAPVRGMSLIHDSGTGSSSGSYGNFESMPVVCESFEKCTVTLDARKRIRKPGQDAASPGYFTSTLNNSMKMEATSTRRAGLIRYTLPAEELAKSGAKLPHVVFDWANDLPGTFRGGELDFDPAKGRIMMNGSYQSSFGSGVNRYRAYACYDLLNEGKQVLGKTGLWQGDRFGQSTVVAGLRHSRLATLLLGPPVQTGAIASWSKFPKDKQGNAVITIRAGLSYISAEQACRNAETEVPKFDFDAVVQKSRALWNEKLNRILISEQSDDKFAQMFYSSMYRSFLSPNNATGEAQGKFLNTPAPYFDGLYCTWDTARTVFPFMSLTSPRDYAEIVETYIDGWRKLGTIPECRANNVPGFTQGGSDGTNVLADFAVKYAKEAKSLGVDLEELYRALKSDAYEAPPEWSQGGRQIAVWQKYGYIPFAVFDPEHVGLQTREASRTLEYAWNDFAIRMVALMLKKPELKDLTKRALYYKNTFNPDLRSRGFTNFVAKRNTDGTFPPSNPTDCSPLDTNQDHACSLQQENTFGVYETSSWEYSLFAPHDFAGLIKLIANGSKEDFIKRVEEFFNAGLYYAGNEPSFTTPIAYSYANRPDLSVRRVRKVVYQNFDNSTNGLPGNDDNAAMATLLSFHLLGFFPVASSREFLITSPFFPAYTIKNGARTVTITAQNFDPRSLAETVPDGARAFVSSVLVNGKAQSSRCKIKFETLFPSERSQVNVTLVMTANDKEAGSCGASEADLPSSLSTGGFDTI